MTTTTTEQLRYEMQAWKIDHVNWRDGDALRPRVAALVLAYTEATRSYLAWAEAVLAEGALYVPGRHLGYFHGLARWLGDSQVALEIAKRCAEGGYPVEGGEELAALVRQALSLAIGDEDPLRVFRGIDVPDPDAEGRVNIEFDLREEGEPA